MEFGNVEQQSILAKTLGSQSYSISSNAYGCKVINKALEVLPPNIKLELIKCILKSNSSLVKLSMDQNGNHVIQKIIEKGDQLDLSINKDNVIKLLRPLLNSFKGNVKDICCHPLGCRVIQRLIETMPTDKLNP